MNHNSIFPANQTASPGPEHSASETEETGNIFNVAVKGPLSGLQNNNATLRLPSDEKNEAEKLKSSPFSILGLSSVLPANNSLHLACNCRGKCVIAPHCGVQLLADTVQ
jgi:hypothetical protein